MKKSRFNIMVIILITIICVALSPVTMQNDTYYSIAIGEHIIENGIDMQDPFSWHENLPYTYPHWGYDVCIYLIYMFGQTIGGVAGGYTAIYISTCILSVILGITMYSVNKKIAKNKTLSFFITIGTMYILKDFIAARAQLITYILFVLEIYFIEKFLESKKKRYVLGLVLIPIVIANMHIAVWYFYFILYLPYIAEYIITLILKIDRKESYKIVCIKNNNTKMLILIMLICLLTGLISPLGTNTYTYLIKTMQGTTTENINEHLPMTLIYQTAIILELAIMFIMIIFTKGKLKLREIFMLGGLIFLMFYSTRHLTMFALIGGIILNDFSARSFKLYNEKSIEILDKDMSSKLAISVISAMTILFSISLFVPKIDEQYVDEELYPVEMSNWILENLSLSNIRLYNEYNYGSYLLYRGIPVFIDSRADLYAPEFNTKTGKAEDGQDIFMDFINTANLNIWCETTFEKYEITHVILYKNSKVNRIIENTNDGKYKILHADSSFILYERVNLDETI